jgi:hypothetical protein
MSIDVMKQALKALERYAPQHGHPDDMSDAITALRTAIKQAEKQEPVGWEHHEYRPYGAPGEIRIHAILVSQYTMPDGSLSGDFEWIVNQYREDKNTIKLIPLYTTPPAAQRQWVGLTDEEMYLNCPNWLSQEQCKAWIQQIEAKLKEKNHR